MVSVVRLIFSEKIKKDKEFRMSLLRILLGALKFTILSMSGIFSLEINGGYPVIPPSRQNGTLKITFLNFSIV